MKKALFCITSLVASTCISSSLAATAPSLKPWMIDLKKNLPLLPMDILSNAEPFKAETTHLVWDVEPDFEQKKLQATTLYTYINKIEGNRFLTLDIANLDIHLVKVNGEEASFTIFPSTVPGKPDALRIEIPSEEGTGQLEIRYNTKEQSTALFWIDKKYTEGKEFPLLYTLFQTNEGASAIPGQHSPQVRLTYQVHVKTDNPDLMVLSSVSNNPIIRNETGNYQDLSLHRAVPLYLLSLQIGHFGFSAYEEDLRTGVYSEEEMLEKVTETFSFLPKVLQSAEEICGPYQWKVYTPILLSWAFPYMAMEHPCASTCGAITLDHPYVIAHELAHSWAGNDITNSTWQQFFWNEGLTTYLEYKISSRTWGEDYASMLFLETLSEMQEAMDTYRETRPDLLRLCQQTSDIEFTRIPYGKGALFFFMLEKALGEDAFSAFLKDYMNLFFESSMSDKRFIAYLKAWLEHEAGVEDPEDFFSQHQIANWLYDMEIPSNAPIFTSSFTQEFALEAEKLHLGQELDVEKIQSWDIAVQSYFLSSLSGKVSSRDLAVLDEKLSLTNTKSMSIKEEWARLCATSNYYTPETSQMIVDYVLQRNSAHKTNQLSLLLNKTREGKRIISMILEQENGKLFPIVKQKILNNYTN